MLIAEESGWRVYELFVLILYDFEVWNYFKMMQVVGIQ